MINVARMEDMPIGRAYTLVRHVTRQDVDTFANLCGDVNPLCAPPKVHSLFGRPMIVQTFLTVG